MVLREEMYFEPRTISPAGNIRWFGEIYTAPQMLCHIEQTVYIRDNGRMLFIYELDSDKLSEEEKIEAVFTLILYFSAMICSLIACSLCSFISLLF